MHELAPLIRDLAIILGVAGVVTLLFQKIKQPVVLGYLIAGMIVGPYTPPHSFVSDIADVKVLAELGVIFLMFALGLEFSFHKLTRVGFSASVTGVVEVVLMFLIGLGVGKVLGWNFNNSLFLGAALSISSTTIIIKALSELHLQQKRFAELIFGVLIVEDLLAILLLVALSTMVTTSHFFSTSMLLATGKLILVVGGWFLVGYFLVPTLLRNVIHFTNNETLTVISVALCLLLVCIAASFHYSVALGAFIMGSILAETAEVHRIENLIIPIRDIFAAIFFVSVGMLINPTVVVEHFWVVILISVVTIVGKVLTSGLGAFLTGQSLNTSLRVGFGMAQIGEFSFIIVGLGAALGAIDNTLYPIIVTVSVITTFTTPYLIRFSGYLNKVIEARLPTHVKYFLESYSAWFFRNKADSAHRVMYRRSIMRFFLNAIVIAIIFILTQNLLLPRLSHYIDQAWLVKIIGWLVALIASSPFIWAMLFSFWFRENQKKPLLLPPLILGMVITMTEVASLSVVYFDTWLVMLVLVFVALAVLALLYNKLERSYHWFERRLVANIRKLDNSQQRFEQLAPWESHLVQLTVTQDSPLSGKSLEDLKIRENLGINIVAIHRGNKTILAPRGKERLLPQDELVVLGNDQQIEQFKALAEKVLPNGNGNYALENFSLKSFLIEPDHPLVGKTIRESHIREKTSGNVVGLERSGIRILNPDPATIIQPKDLLFVVGETKLLQDLK